MRVHIMSNQFVTPQEDVKDGGTITIADEGEFRVGEYGTKLVVKVALPSGAPEKAVPQSDVGEQPDRDLRG